MTTDADAFLNAIAETPDEDAPRLVFADWLDEQGESARAEFIRVQCAAEAWPEQHPQRDRLEQRAGELLCEHRPKWNAGITQGPRGVSYRRGFIDEIQVDDADWVRRLPTLAAVRPHALIRVDGATSGTATTIADMSELADVRRLSLADVEETPESVLGVLLRSPHLRCLTELAIQRMSGDPSPLLATWPGLALLRKLSITCGNLRRVLASPHLTRLRSLELLGSERSRSDSIRALLDWPGLESLEELWLRDVDDDDLSALAESGRAIRLRRLHVDSELASPVAILRLLSGGLSSLHELTFETFLVYRHETDYDSVPTTSESGEPLENLQISNFRLSDVGASWLAACPRLAGVSVLSLRDCDIGPDGARALAVSPNLAAVRYLCLGSNPLGSEGVRALAESPHLVVLEILNLFGVQLDEIGFMVMSHSPWVRSLTHLHLGNPSFSLTATRVLADCPFDSLQSLVLFRSGADWPTLAGADWFGRLTHLRLSAEGSFDDAGLTALANSLGPTLHTLELNHTAFGVIGLRALLARSLPGLRVLDLTGTPIGTAGVRALADWPGLATLRILRVGECGLDGDGIKLLAALRQQWGLREW